MKTRKVISAILAGACALSALSFTATAATNEKEVKAAGATSFKVSAGLVVPALSVTVPSTVSAVINPYGVAVKDAKGTEYGSEGVTSAVYNIVNKTDACAVKVVGTASLTVPITGKAATTTTDDTREATIKVVDDVEGIADSEVKTLCAYVLATEMSAADAWASVTVTGKDGATATAAPIFEYPEITKNLITPASDEVTPVKFEKGKTLTFTDLTVTKDNDGKGEVDKKDLMTIPPAKLPKKNAETSVWATGTYYYGQFQLGGEVTPNDNLPAGGTWGTADKLTLNLVLDIQPAADPRPKE